MNFFRAVVALLTGLPLLAGAASFTYEPAPVNPPPPLREFRGAWLATVGNIDWPSKPGLPVARQQAELVALLDRAVQLKLNAIIFQVRPSADALYASSLEPWSEYLMGRMGQAPQPLYDPLAFAVAEAHRRGLELHAWFNPFRAQHALAKSPPSPGHVSRAHPEWVRKYGDELDLDPGEPGVREFVRRVVMDVVNRYDIDGVHFDDYFYPYPIKDARKQDVDFPDQSTWLRYGAFSGMNRADWRRQNINLFVRSIYTSIKSAKPWVKFGISPFGIWRPLNPPSVQGFDAYAKLYADSRLWLASGWVDYLSPQLYWSVTSPQQSFPALLGWWRAQNVLHRNLWPGLADYRTGQLFATNEIYRQIAVTRAQNVRGMMHYHLRSLEENPALVAAVQSAYAEPALVPASPWLADVMPAIPTVRVYQRGSGTHVKWYPGGTTPIRNWVLQTFFHGEWQTEILPAQQTAWDFIGQPPEVIAVRACDRVGNLSAPAGVQLVQPRYTGGRNYPISH